MCGIAGIIGAEAPAGTLEAMTRRLAHRGPDDSGIHRSPGAELGHTRLSILDLSSAGHQPMTLGPLTLVYNGEIYNFRELRDDLPGPFRSDCDSEVILHLYARDGADCVDALRGMFSFAIWDASRRTLFAARDRLGIKPFHYRELAGGIAFASEIKALLELGRPSVDTTALRDFFTYKCAMAPKTIYAGIRQLPAAHTLRWDGSLHLSRYWTPSLATPMTDGEEAAERVGELLASAIPEQTLADVPVGVFLSGGIDSATVVAHLQHPRTFTLATDVRHRDESGLARSIADHFGTRHHEVLAKAFDLEEALDAVTEIFDEPFGDSAAWSVYLVSQLARERVKVALSGEGGDELFSGYDKYSKWFTDPSPLLHAPLVGLLPPFARSTRSLERRTGKGLERYAAYLSPFTLRQKNALLHPDLLDAGYDDLWHLRKYWREDLEPLHRMRWVDLNTDLPGCLLTKVDRSSMAHSLEVRPPLLDHRLVELALSIDPRLLRDVRANRGKLVIRRLLDPRMPPGHFDHPKRGFNLPIRTWLRQHPGVLDAALRRLAAARIVVPPKRHRFSNEQSWMLLALDRWLTHAGAI